VVLADLVTDPGRGGPSGRASATPQRGRAPTLTLTCCSSTNNSHATSPGLAPCSPKPARTSSKPCTEIVFMFARGQRLTGSA
jgi:hypothetical protein